MARTALDEALNIAGYVMLCWFAYRATYVVENGLRRWTAAGVGHNDGLLLSLLGSALRIGVVAASVIVGLTLLPLPPGFDISAGRVTSIVLIVSLALMVWLSVATGQRLVLTRFDLTAADNLRARRIATQLHIISRVVYIAIALLAGAAILMLFPTVRHVGTSLLASAGIAGVIAGFSAQKILGNLFAGVQIALAQTIRQDDVVVVEGEWGRIEEITLSYVVVHIWDDRRLVLPLSYFIEKPFENWTRTTSALTGSVIVWVDYRIDVADARNALKEIIENSALWDRRFWNLQVSDTSEHTVQLRVLATSSDSSKSWDLRCEIREKFIAFMQRRHPESLPRRRTELIGADIALPESARRTGTAA
jgi:small-conductance mechanosensitive channel